jgi:hypothetical protein
MLFAAEESQPSQEEVHTEADSTFNFADALESFVEAAASRAAPAIPHDTGSNEAMDVVIDDGPQPHLQQQLSQQQQQRSSTQIASIFAAATAASPPAAVPTSALSAPISAPPALQLPPLQLPTVAQPSLLSLEKLVLPMTNPLMAPSPITLVPEVVTSNATPAQPQPALPAEVPATVAVSTTLVSTLSKSTLMPPPPAPSTGDEMDVDAEGDDEDESDQQQRRRIRKKKRPNPVALADEQPCPRCGQACSCYYPQFIDMSAQMYEPPMPPHDRADSLIGIYVHYVLENHVHNVVRGMMNFKCIYPNCSAKFFTEFELNNHIENVHLASIEAKFFSYPKRSKTIESSTHDDYEEHETDGDMESPRIHGAATTSAATATAPSTDTAPATASADADKMDVNPPAAIKLSSSISDVPRRLSASSKVKTYTLSCEYPNCTATFGGPTARLDRRRHVEGGHIGIHAHTCMDCTTVLYSSYGGDRRRFGDGEFPPAKRGRGRPRKYPRSGEAPPVTSNFVGPDGQPVKRGRGRPRKYPRPNDAKSAPIYLSLWSRISVLTFFLHQFIPQTSMTTPLRLASLRWS